MTAVPDPIAALDADPTTCPLCKKKFHGLPIGDCDVPYGRPPGYPEREPEPARPVRDESWFQQAMEVAGALFGRTR